MSLAQSKKLSQLTADNAQWEDRQLLRSEVVRGTEVKTTEQVDADIAVVGDDGEVDFKEDCKFAQHLKKHEAVGNFTKSKTLSQ
ncbi:hypothetical protein AgCh_020430 [Apium graveolens]